MKHYYAERKCLSSAAMVSAAMAMLACQNDQLVMPTPAFQKDRLVTPTLVIVSGNNQIGSPAGFTDQPMKVEVANNGGVPLQNAPVTFRVITGGGLVAATRGGPTVTSLSLRTDCHGLAQAFYLHPNKYNTVSTVAAVTSGRSAKFTESTSTGDGTFDAPTNISTSTAKGSTEIDLTWINNASTAAGLLIEQSTDNVHWTTTAQLSDPTATSYAVTGLTFGQTYYFRISGTK